MYLDTLEFALTAFGCQSTGGALRLSMDQRVFYKAALSIVRRSSLTNRHSHSNAFVVSNMISIVKLVVSPKCALLTKKFLYAILFFTKL